MIWSYCSPLLSRLDVHLTSIVFQVDPFSSVSAAHDVGENVRRKIQQSHPEIAEVFIHIGEPLLSLSAKKIKREQNKCN